jgi:hypothetical protein
MYNDKYRHTRDSLFGLTRFLHDSSKHVSPCLLASCTSLAMYTGLLSDSFKRVSPCIPACCMLLNIHVSIKLPKQVSYTELQISCVFVFFTLWKLVKTHVLSDQSGHITHTYCCVSKLTKFRAYITIHFCLWEIPCNYFPLYFSKERAYTSEGYRMLVSKEIWLDVYDKSSNRRQY